MGAKDAPRMFSAMEFLTFSILGFLCIGYGLHGWTLLGPRSMQNNGMFCQFKDLGKLLCLLYI